MKAFLLIILTFGIFFLIGASAEALSSKYWICHTPSLKAVYAYPTGSYWVNQINQFPDYYSVHNATYLARYGC